VRPKFIDFKDKGYLHKGPNVRDAITTGRAGIWDVKIDAFLRFFVFGM